MKQVSYIFIFLLLFYCASITSNDNTSKITAEIQPAIQTDVELPPFLARITDIEWNLETIYEEYLNVNVTLHYTIVTFKYGVEIWNTLETNYTETIFSNSCAYEIAVITDLEDKNLTLKQHYGCFQVLCPVTYPPGLTNDTVSYPFNYNRPNITELASGCYRIFLLESYRDSWSTFGLNITVSAMNSTIEYDPIPDNWGTLNENIDNTRITPSWNVFLLLLSFFVFFPLKNRKNK